MPCSSRIGLNNDPSVLFSRSHYEFIIIRATRVPSSREGSERTGEKRVGAPSGARSARTPAEERMVVCGNDGAEGRWWRAAFCRGGRHRENRPGEPRFPGTERYPVPSSANPRGRKAVARIWGTSGAPGVPLPGFLCTSADRPKRVYGTSPYSPRKARPARFFTAKWHYRFTSRGLHLKREDSNAAKRNDTARLIMKGEKCIGRGRVTVERR